MLAADWARFRYQAKLFEEFLPVEELLPMAQAIGRVFARLGEKKNRNTARMKFLIVKLGMEEFKRLVLEERASLPEDPRWTGYLKDVDQFQEMPLKPPALLQLSAPGPEGFEEWRRTQRLPSAASGLRHSHCGAAAGRHHRDPVAELADLARKYVKETIRTTVEQNIVLRWVSEADLPALYAELRDAGLHALGRRHDRRRRCLPGHRHLQVGYCLLARPGGRTPHAPGGKECSHG